MRVSEEQHSEVAHPVDDGPKSRLTVQQLHLLP